MSWKLPDEAKIFPFLVIVAIILIANPIIINLGKGPNSLMSEESYYHLRMIDQYRDSSIYTQDILQEKEISFDIFYFLVAKSNMPNSFIINILPVLLGFIAFILFYFILKKGEFENNTLLFALIILISSPIYIYSFSTINPDSFYIVIMLAAILSYLRKSYLTPIFSGLLAILNIPYFIALIVIYSVYTLSNEEKKSYFLSITITISIFAAAIYYGLFGLPNIFSQSFVDTGLSSLFSTLGGVKGYSSISLVLTTIGMFVFWKRSFSRLILYFAFLILLIVSVYYIPIRLVAIFICALFAGKALSNLVIRYWNVSLLKDITILLIVCSIIFSTVVFMKTEINYISSEQIDGLKFLSSVDKNKVIFSVEEKGYAIQKISNRKTYLDSKSHYFKDYETRLNKSDILFYSRNLQEIEEVLNSENIDHIYIDDDLFNGRVWNGPDEGALFIYENSKKFVKVFDNNEVQIYRYIKN